MALWPQVVMDAPPPLGARRLPVAGWWLDTRRSIAIWAGGTLSTPGELRPILCFAALRCGIAVRQCGRHALEPLDAHVLKRDG